MRIKLATIINPERRGGCAQQVVNLHQSGAKHTKSHRGFRSFRVKVVLIAS
jgi:hypothetical protein